MKKAESSQPVNAFKNPSWYLPNPKLYKSKKNTSILLPIIRRQGCLLIFSVGIGFSITDGETD